MVEAREEKEALWRTMTVSKYSEDKWGWDPKFVPDIGYLACGGTLLVLGMLLKLERRYLGKGWVLLLGRGGMSVFALMIRLGWVIYVVFFLRVYGGVK